MALEGTTTAAWLGVVAFGAWHGLNPAMGWPLAVANGLAARRGSAVFATAWPLGAGHLAAMAVALVPFALLAWYVEWSRAIRLAAGLAVCAYGLWRLLRPRHPRALARIAPTRLAWWSFLMATAHGAGLMLVPITLALCAPPGGGHGHAAALGTSLGIALAVALVHSAAMLACGIAMAWAVYRWLGLKALRSAWLNLDAVWAASLLLAGAVGAWWAWRWPGV